MPAGPLGQERDRFDPCQAGIGEKLRQFKGPAKITPAGGIFGAGVKRQHEHAALPLLRMESIEVTQNRGLHLRVARAGDRQPHRHTDDRWRRPPLRCWLSGRRASTPRAPPRQRQTDVQHGQPHPQHTAPH